MSATYFSGKASECFKYWASFLPTTKKVVRRKILLARFVGVTEETLDGWISGKHPPKSTAYLRLQFFFRDICRYGVEELQRLEEHSPLLLRLGEIMAYSVVDISTVMSSLGGYTQSHQVYRLFDGFSRPSVSREVKIKILCEANFEALNEKRAYWSREFGVVFGSRQTPAEILSAVLAPLCALADRLGEEDREAFRKELGEEKLRLLAESLWMLRSEALRSVVIRKRKQIKEDIDEDEAA